MARSDLDAAAEAYRRSLDARELAAVRATNRAYRLAINAIDQRIEQLRRGIEDRPDAEWRGYAIAQQESLRDTIEAELATAARSSSSMIDAQRVAAFIESREITRRTVAASLERAGYVEVAAQLGGAVNRASLSQMIAQVQRRSPVATMLARHSRTGARAAADRLVVGVATGRNPRQLVGGIRASLNTEAWKAERIARTEVIRAHTAGNIGLMRETPQITPMYEWAADVGSACVACLAEHGSLHPTDEAPARHPNCKCVMLPVVIDPTTGEPLSQPGETGQDVIDRMTPAEARERFGKTRGDLLTATGSDRVPLADMLTKRESATWGDSIAVVPLKDLAP